MARRAIRNLVCTAGDDYDHEITFVDSAGDPVDVTTWSFAGKLRALSDATVATAFTIVQTAANKIVVSLSAAQTLALTDSSKYDLERTVAGKKLTFQGGSFVTDAQQTY